MKSSSLSKEIRNSIPIHTIMINIVKDLLLNELELVYLAIYLDRFSWKTEGFSVEETIYTTAVVVKMLLNCEEQFKIITAYLSSENQTLELNLTKYLLYIGKNNNVLNIQPSELNSKFVELSKVSSIDISISYICYHYILYMGYLKIYLFNC